MQVNPTRTAVLLVGGQSSRMGKDKFSMNINGEQQWEFMVAELETFFDAVYISCRPDQARHFEGQSLILDEHADLGPMGALYSTFRKLQDISPIFFVACDLPNFSSSLSAKLHTRLTSGYDVVAAKDPARESAEPLVAFWNRSAAAMIEQCIAQGNYALYKCMQQLRVKEVKISTSEVLLNVNRPSDL